MTFKIICVIFALQFFYMIVRRNVTEDKTGKLIECIIDSSNILRTEYFAHRNRLFIYYRRGHAYSYANITEDIYDDFENAESQGDFLQKHIMKNPQKFPYMKEFKLNESEIQEVKDIIDEWKNN